MTELEQEPPVAAALFGDRIDLARRYTTALAEEGERRGLIGPLELPRLWTRHVLNCAIAAPLFSGHSADIGSGAGLPGIVLAIARPDVTWTLVEPMERRVAWLAEQVDGLGLDNVDVVRSRAEEWSAPGGVDVVTARAVSALRTLLPLTAPHVRPGGRIALFKGRGAEVEIESAAKQLRRFHVSDVDVVTLGDGVLDETTRVVVGTVGA